MAAASSSQVNPGSPAMSDAHLQHLQESLVDKDSIEDPHALPKPRATLDFEDRREERRRCGQLKWKTEKGVPDVGGLGWRSRTGHLLKNQTYYATKPQEHLWDNPTHAGPVTWKEYHGPKLRNDAPLMARLDRLDVDQDDWEAKKAFVNTTRVQTLDRLYHTKVENYQKEMASQWAPHKRSRKEVHQSYDCFTSELDSMPMKELKKVLTPAVLKADRDAIRMITKRVQLEETWKSAWKQMEKDRRDDTKAVHEQRMAFNDMLMEISGQPPRQRNPAHRVPNSCTQRVEELAQPTGPRHAVTHGGVTQMVDYKGLFHVDNKRALEARFPGRGHAMSQAFGEKATESARAGWPPPPPPDTPTDPPRRDRMRSEDFSHLRRPSAPVTRVRLDTAKSRMDAATMELDSREQFLRTEPPPPPEQKDQLVQEALVNDPLHMHQDLSPRSEHTACRDRVGTADALGMSPPRRSMVYHVVVPTAEAGSERPNWRPKRSPTNGGLPTEKQHTPQSSAPASARGRGRWPPVGSRPLSVRVVRASGLPRGDRSGHSDPYFTCQVSGKARSRAKTRVVEDTEEPVFDEELVVEGWRPGDPLVLSVFDHDVVGQDDMLASVELSSSQFFPHGFSGVVSLNNMWSAQGQRIDEELRRRNVAAEPIVELVVSVQDVPTALGASSDDEEAAGHAGPAAYSELAMPNAEPSVKAVCDHLADFEKSVVPVPRLGNFWMTPRGPIGSVGGGAAARSAR